MVSTVRAQVWKTVSAVLLLFVAGCSREPTPVMVPLAPAPVVDPSKLLGRWLRPDGGYVLEIGAQRAGGELEARYFNPRPIHVGRSVWRAEGEKLLVTVVLQDANYPGSTYELLYLPAADRLVGDYFQPALDQHFEVEFVRP